jgi:hypothetical protein
MARIKKKGDADMRGTPMFSDVVSVLAFVSVVFLAVPGAEAALAGTVPTLPSDTVLPGLVASGTASGTLLASVSVPYIGSLGTPGGTAYSAVYREGGGTLDFYYQVTNLDTSQCGGAGQILCDSIARGTAVSFLGFSTALGFRLDGGSFGGPFVAGTVTPVTGDRNSIGDVVGFSFTPPDSRKVQPGQVSSVLIISTNATNFTIGNLSVIDGGTTTVASFAPAASTPVPEPTPLLLLIGGVIGLAVRRLRSL